MTKELKITYHPQKTGSVPRILLGRERKKYFLSTSSQPYPNVAKVGGLQSQGVKVEIVVGYIDPLTTQDLKSSGFPVG